MGAPFSWFVATAVLLGCGGDGDGSGDRLDLSCEYAGSPDNCWSVVVSQLDACVTGDGATFNSDRTVCEYDDETRIDFTEPLDTSLWEFSSDDDPAFDGTLRDASGAECARVTVTSTETSIAVGSETVSLEQAGFSLVLTCPDGTAYSGGADLLNCTDDAPGARWSSSNFGDARFYAYDVIVSGDSDVEVFNCLAP